MKTAVRLSLLCILLAGCNDDNSEPRLNTLVGEEAPTLLMYARSIHYWMEHDDQARVQREISQAQEYFLASERAKEIESLAAQLKHGSGEQVFGAWRDAVRLLQPEPERPSAHYRNQIRTVEQRLVALSATHEFVFDWDVME